MNQEAIEKLKQFQIKNHLSGYNLQQPEGDTQDDKVSEQHSVAKPKKINYPDHIKPLKDRIMSALNNGARTPDAVANYCGENIKLITLQLGRWVSRGLIGRHTNPQSGITRYYPHDIAKEKGILGKPQPINRKKKFVMPKSLKKADEALAAKQLDLFKDTPAKLISSSAGKDYVAFLEKRIAEWQTESRKQAHEILELRDEASKLRNALSKAMERHGVAEEVTQLRATVAYLESKLFGDK